MDTVKTKFGHTLPVVDPADPRVIAVYWEGIDRETGDATWGWTEPGTEEDLQYGSSLDMEFWDFYPVTFMTDAQVKEAGFDPR